LSFSPKLLFILNLAGCVALLLWGSYMVRGAVEKAYSARIGAFIKGTSRSQLKSLFCGLVSALVLQSTTAAVMLTTSFVRAGLLALPVAIVIIIGADLGSAIAVRILFLDLSFLGPLLLFTGLCLHRFAGTWRKQQLGRICIGLGLMLLSIQLIRQLIGPMAANAVSSDFLVMLDSSPWFGLVLAALATWLAHSSVAVILIVASMSQAGVLGPEIFLALLLGANIGSGLIPLTLVSKRHSDSYSAVVANCLMRSGLAVVVMVVSPLLIENMGAFGESGGSQVVNIHITFNIVLALIFVPLSNFVADFSRRLLSSGSSELLKPDSHVPGSSLDPGLVSKPQMALSCARREAFRLADNTEALFSTSLQMFEATDRLAVERFIERDREINMRNKAIQNYLAETRRHIHAKHGEQSDLERRLDEILRFSATMENIGDIVSYNLARLAVKRLDRGVEFSSTGFEELSVLHNEVVSLIQLEITNFAAGENARKKPRDKLIDQITQLGKESISSHRLRLSARKSSSIGTSSIHQDAVRDLMQVVTYIANMEIS
jgi:phosphate:Na+ symporter